MLLNYIRLIKNTTDYSLQNQDDTQTVPLALITTDYLYVAQRYPFNSLFFHMDTVNSNTSVITVDIWDGTAWRAAVDVLDGTSVSGKSLAQSGALQWNVDDDYSWQKVVDTSDTYAPTALQSFKIYNAYWMRLKVSANLSAGTDSKEICYAFTNSQRLKDFDIEIDTYLESFATGKTDWINEIKTGSKLVVQELQKLGLIVAPGQIMELDDLYVPTSLRTLALIYSNLGSGYKEKVNDKLAEFSKALNIRRFSFDSNADGKITADEMYGTTKRVFR